MNAAVFHPATLPPRAVPAGLVRAIRAWLAGQSERRRRRRIELETLAQLTLLSALGDHLLFDIGVDPADLANAGAGRLAPDPFASKR